jgi:hypothetical protein
MHRFWIVLPLALAFAAPAHAGKLGSVEQAAKTYVAKKETTGGSSHHAVAGVSHGKASQLLGKGKKILGK